MKPIDPEKDLDRLIDAQIEDWKAEKAFTQDVYVCGDPEHCPHPLHFMSIDEYEARQIQRARGGFVPIFLLIIAVVAVASLLAVRHEQKVNDKAQMVWPSMSIPNYDNGGQ